MSIFNRESPYTPKNIWQIVPFISGRSVKDHFLLLIDDPKEKMTYKITIKELKELLK